MAVNNQTDTQLDLLPKLDQSGVLIPEVKQLFHSLRRCGNEAAHGLLGEHKTALENLKVARKLGIWFYRTFRDPNYSPGPFIPSQVRESEAESLKLEIAALKEVLARHQTNIVATQTQASAAQALAEQAQEEAKLWESLATEAELTQAQLKAELVVLQAQAAEQPQMIQTFITNAKTASLKVELDESATTLAKRRIIWTTSPASSLNMPTTSRP